MTAYAVRGLDINTSYTIYNLLNEQKKKGVAVIYVGEDLDVLLELCDRILVLCGGQVNGIVDGRNDHQGGGRPADDQSGKGGEGMSQYRPHKEPLLRIAKRDGMSAGQGMAGPRHCHAAGTGGRCAVFIFAVTGLNPLHVYAAHVRRRLRHQPAACWITIRDAIDPAVHRHRRWRPPSRCASGTSAPRARSWWAASPPLAA